MYLPNSEYSIEISTLSELRICETRAKLNNSLGMTVFVYKVAILHNVSLR